MLRRPPSQDPLHHPDEYVGRNRLLQERVGAGGAAVAEGGVAGIARHPDHREIRVVRREPLHQLAPAELRHDDVREHDVDATDAGEALERLPSVARLAYLVTFPFQGPAHDRPHRLLVVYHQEARRPRHRNRRAGSLRPGLRRTGNRGEEHRELGPLTRAALRPDVSSRLGDDPVDGCQTEPGALSLSLGGKEGLEDVGQVLRPDAGAVVADRK